MYKLIGDAVATVTALKPLVANANHCEVVVAPPYTAIKSVADRLEGSNIKVAAWTSRPSRNRARTRAKSAATCLKDAGASHVIIGHSERRSMYCETDETVNRKFAALGFNLTPIVCVGETLDERDAGREEEVVATQLARSLADLTAKTWRVSSPLTNRSGR